MTAPITYRTATPDDAPRLAANSVFAYPDEANGIAARTEAYRSGQLFPLETVTVAERAGEMVGQSRTIPYRGWLGGVETRVGGLAGVAVSPEARRTGVAGGLVRHHVAELRASATPWAMLYPFAPKFYAAFGWAPAARRLRWRLSPHALPLCPERRLVRRLDLGTSDLGAVQSVYDRHCLRQSGSLSRPARLLQAAWERSRDQRGWIGVRSRDGLSGYLTYALEAPTPRPQTLAVREWVALDTEAERALLGFLAAQADQVDTVTLDTPVDHPLAGLLDGGLPAREDDSMPPEHHPLATLYSGLMARVIDLAGALAGRGYGGRSGSVAVEITADELVPENRAVFTVTVDNGAPRVQPGRLGGAPIVRGPVGAVSAVLCGGIRLNDALAHRLLEVEGAATPAHDLLALPVPYPLVVF